MGVSYQAVGWNRQKKLYDWLIFAGCMVYLLLFCGLTLIFNPQVTFETLLIRSSATLAVLLLHIILSIGPLCRINQKFLPLLYNRRHLGVTMFVVALIHGGFSILQFHSLGNIGPLVSLFSSNTRYGSLVDFPFQALGFFSLLILFLMAVTSHDFWLHHLSPRVWKTLHMFVYLAYVLIILHVMLGVIQFETNPIFVWILFVGAVTLISLHVYAGSREVKKGNIVFDFRKNDFVKVCSVTDINENRAKIFCIGQENIAVFKTGGKLFAVNNSCKHQGGPLGEGKIVDGCITCPWHGYQYLPNNGQSPPPFKEKISTYDLKIEGTDVWLNPIPYPEGTERSGVNISGESTTSRKESEDFYIGWKAAAPKIFAGFIRRYILVMLPLIMLLAVMLALSQKKFGTGNFEYGQLTEVTGVYFNKPVPMMKVVNGKDILGNPSCIRIPLVGYGKNGAEGTMTDIEKEKNISLNQKQITLKGTLLYNDGKTILQVDKNDHPVTKISLLAVSPDLLPQIKELGTFKVKGEIIDPKCYFGVMKPGEGKPHRDCAIRCILGGIPPMLAIKNDRGESNYLILLNANGEPLNQAVQDYVAEPVEVNARLVQYDDWIVAYINKKEAIQRFSYLKARFGNSIQYCSANGLK